MKKKVLFIATLLCCFMTTVPVYAANLQPCRKISPNIDVKLASSVHTIILAIQIAIPVVLVIFGMLDLFRGITAQKDDEIKKGQQTFIKRIIAAAVVFFVILVVKLVIGMLTDGDENKTTIMNCAACFILGPEDDGSCGGW